LNIPWTARKQSDSIEVPAQNLSLAPGQRVEALADQEGIDKAFLHHWASLWGERSSSQGIEETIRSYCQAVQTRQVDRRILGSVDGIAEGAG
jgi:hypothetical protein